MMLQEILAFIENLLFIVAHSTWFLGKSYEIAELGKPV
jgi:hypothetical protein